MGNMSRNMQPEGGPPREREPRFERDLRYESDPRFVREPRAERMADARAGKGSVAEVICGGAAVFFSILALIGVLPTFLTCLATIAIGAGLLLYGAGISRRFNHLMTRYTSWRHEVGTLGTGLTVHILGGAATAGLGIVALFGLETVSTLAVASIVAGGTLAFGSGANSEVSALSMRGWANEQAERASHQAVLASTGTQVFAGVAAVVMGILVLAAVGAPAALLKASMLTLGAALLLGGATVASRIGTGAKEAPSRPGP